MTAIEYIEKAKSMIIAVRESPYIPFDIMSSCEAKYLEETIKYLNEAIEIIKSDLYSNLPTDMAENHDKYLADEYEGRKHR